MSAFVERDEILVLSVDDDLAGALQREESFVVRAPLGERSEVRALIRSLAVEQGRRVEVSMAWHGLVDPEPGETYGDYFYVR